MIVKYCSILFVVLTLTACGVKRDLTLPEKAQQEKSTVQENK